MTPARALMVGDVRRIRVRARNGVTREVHATLADGQRVDQPVAGRFTAPAVFGQRNGVYRRESTR